LVDAFVQSAQDVPHWLMLSDTQLTPHWITGGPPQTAVQQDGWPALVHCTCPAGQT
jgi:hypothetical protein